MEKWVMEESVENFYTYGFSGHLIEDDDNEGKGKVDFNAIDIIAEEDWSNDGEQNESGNENDDKNIRLESDSDIPFVSYTCLNLNKKQKTLKHWKVFKKFAFESYRGKFSSGKSYEMFCEWRKFSPTKSLPEEVLADKVSLLILSIPRQSC